MQGKIKKLHSDLRKQSTKHKSKGRFSRKQVLPRKTYRSGVFGKSNQFSIWDKLDGWTLKDIEEWHWSRKK